jgi:DNA invertase Pin-like site-specific DNA recombinase
MTNAVIYNRVSTLGQNKYNGSVSLQAQESACSKYAYMNGLRVKSIYKEIHSAYNKIPCVLNSVINLQKISIIISSVDRFSRSVSIGISMATSALKNKNQIIFVQENFTCSATADLKLLKLFLEKTEEESNVLSVRIKKSKSFLSDEGYFTGGRVPYGFKLENKVLAKHDDEQNIINFIILCKNKNISSIDLNTSMLKINKLKIFHPIECYDAKDNNVEKLTKRLYNAEIASLLNSYDVKKRGVVWNSTSVSFASRANQRKLKISKSPSPILIKRIEFINNSPDALVICDSLKTGGVYRKRSIDSVDSDASELSQECSTGTSKKRRSARINNLSNASDKISISDQSFSLAQPFSLSQPLLDYSKNHISTSARANNIRININDDADYKLFEQFKLFKQFQNLNFGE